MVQETESNYDLKVLIVWVIIDVAYLAYSHIYSHIYSHFFALQRFHGSVGRTGCTSAS